MFTNLAFFATLNCIFLSIKGNTSLKLQQGLKLTRCIKIPDFCLVKYTLFEQHLPSFPSNPTAYIQDNPGALRQSFQYVVAQVRRQQCDVAGGVRPFFEQTMSYNTFSFL